MAQIEITSYELNNKTITKSPATDCWRLVYNDSVAYSLFESNSTTETPYTLECYTTEQECWDRSTELGLDVSALIKEEVEPIEEEYTPFEEL